MGPFADATRGLMAHHPVKWRIRAFGAALALTAGVAAMLAGAGGAAVHAQSIMRSPNLNIGPRISRINPNIGARVNPTAVGRAAATNIGRSGPTISTSHVGPRISTIRSVPHIGVRSATSAAMRPAAMSRPPSAMAAAMPRSKARPAARAATSRRRRSTSAPSPTKSSPRSTARCRTRRPTRWRGVTVWCGWNRRIFH